MSARFATIPSPEERTAFEEACARAGVTIGAFTEHAPSRQSFGILAGSPEFTFPGAIVATPPRIALWIEPRMPQALGSLVQALGGAGAPAGVTLTATTLTGILIEVQDEVSPLVMVVRLVDVELGRYGMPGRNIAFASPVSADAIARIAADGLGEPEIDASRIIEYHLQDVP